MSRTSTAGHQSLAPVNPGHVDVDHGKARTAFTAIKNMEAAA